MITQYDELLNQSAENQQTWLRNTAPTYNADLLVEWREWATHFERVNPQTALQIAKLLEIAADVWQHATTRAAAHHIEANARMLLGQQPEALAQYEAAAAIYRAQNSPADVARVAVGQIGVLQFLGRYPEAQDLAQTTLSDAPDALTRAKILLNSGLIAARQAQFEQARAAFSEAETLFAANNAPQHVAMAQGNAAIVLTELNDFRQAAQQSQAARTFFAAAEMQSVVAQIDLNLAYLRGSQGDYQQALIDAARARAVFAAQANGMEQAQVDLHRSDFYLALNLWYEAQQQVESALPHFEAAGMAFEIGRLHLNHAAALAHSDQFEAAIAAIERAQEIFSAENNPVWQAIATLYHALFDWRRGHTETLTDRVTACRATFEMAQLPNRIAQCDLLLGEVALVQNDGAQAESHFARALALTTDLLPPLTFLCHDGLGRVAEQRADLSAARQHYRAAVDNLERLHTAIGAQDYKLAFLSDKLDVYERLVGLCLRVGSAESQAEAFETVERARSRALLDQLARTTSADATPLDELRQLKQELNWYYNRLNTPQDDPTRHQHTQLTDEIAKRERRLTDLHHLTHNRDLVKPLGQQTVTLPELQMQLPYDTLLLEFVTVRGQLFVFGIGEATLWVQALAVDEETIGTQVAQLRFQINKFNYSKRYRTRYARQLQQSCDSCLQQLYDAVWRPIAARVTNRNVVIVPHGLLHNVPFQALYDGENYLLARHTLSLAPSASVFCHTLQPVAGTTQRGLFVGVDDPHIPHATCEAQEAARLFGEQAELRLNDAATLDDLDDFQLLHLATHATFRADNPLFSALKLADGWMNVHDIYALPAAPPLITLSACGTHQHQVVTGDELIGLCRGFFAAGARSLVVSLWMVDDKVTQQLMELFYARLQMGTTVASALRHAQLTLQSEITHPYFWAAFVVTGNPNLRLKVVR